MNLIVHLIQEGLISFYAIAPNWGLTIILFTASIRIIMLPLQVLVLREQSKLKKLKPELDRLASKYKSDAEKLFRERAALMKTSGARPAILLIAMAIQIPIFIGMYKAIPNLQMLNTASFGWIPKLGHADPFLILPFLAALAVWFQSRQTSEQPKLFSYVFPMLTFVFLYSLPAALALYSLTSTIVLNFGMTALQKFGAA